MNIFRITTKILALTLLVACGGGGSSGTAATPATPQVLPDALITNVETARSRVGGTTLTTTPTSTQIQQTIGSRVMDADTLMASDAYVVSAATPDGATVSTNGNVNINGNIHRVTLEEIQMGVEDRFELTRFNSRYAHVMVDQGVMFAQYRAAGRNDGDVYEYQSYGGWLADSAFSVDMLTINDGSDDESSMLVGISYGEESGSRPTVSGNVSWTGAVIGVEQDSGDVIQGNVNVGANISSEIVIIFDALVNINSGSSVSGIAWSGVAVETDGTFSSTTDGDVNGTFYGTGHTEVGGTFNRDGIIGAFGARR
ncbi:MAG: hypothetical protein OXF29_08280 [Hyphomicrobiales bacterium]|nr:hypothetical protein [Hyphomicrobiales bacterium]